MRFDNNLDFDKITNGSKRSFIEFSRSFWNYMLYIHVFRYIRIVTPDLKQSHCSLLNPIARAILVDVGYLNEILGYLFMKDRNHSFPAIFDHC